MDRRCRACLSTERKLAFLLGTLRDLFSKFVPQISENEKVQICWECRANVRHIYLFCKKAQQSQQVFHDYNLQGSISEFSNIESKSSLVTTLTEIISASVTNYDDTYYTVNLLEIPIKEEPKEKRNLDCGNEFQDYNLKGPISEYSNTESTSSLVTTVTETHCVSNCDDNINITANLHEIQIKEEPTEKVNLDCEIELPITVPATKTESTKNKNCDSLPDCNSEIKNIRNSVKKRKSVRKIHDSYTCKVCGKVFNTYGKFSYHAGVHQTRPQCKECGQTFICKSSLWKHNSLVHKDIKKFFCDLCQRIFFTEAGYQSHISNHTESRDENFCRPCGKFFKTNDFLRKHQQTSKKHFDPETWIHGCSQCDRKFSLSSLVKGHYKRVHAEKKFTCDQCPMKYSTASVLRKHVKEQHEKVIKLKDKVCEFCGKGFKTTQVLKAHRYTHTGERPFICSLCPARFTHNGTLYTHKRLVHQRVKRPRRADTSQS